MTSTRRAALAGPPRRLGVRRHRALRLDHCRASRRRVSRSCAALVAVLMLGGSARLAAIAVAVAVVGLGWGSLRMEALGASVLGAELGETGVAELVTVAPARSSPWSTRVIAMTREFRRTPVRERVLLVLPVGRSPPRGAILEATVRVEEPRPSRDGFDERAWLARQGIHVVLDASSWRQLGRRGRHRGARRPASRPDRARCRARNRRGSPRHRPRRRSRRGRGVTGVRAGRLPRLGALSPARRLGSERRVPRGRRPRPRLAVALAASRARARDGRRDRRVRPRRRLAAVGRARRRRRDARVARVARRTADRPLALPRGRRARTPRLDADVGAGSGLPALVRCGGGHLRRRSAPPRRSSTDCRSRGASPRRWRSPLPAVSQRRRSCSSTSARRRSTRFSRTLVAFAAAPLVLAFGLLAALVDPVSPGAAAGLASLAGWAAAWLELVARVVADLPSARIGARPAIGIALAVRGLLARGSPHPTASGPRRAPATRRARARIRDARRGRRCVGGDAACTGVEPAGRPAGDVPRRRTGRFGASRDAVERGSSSTKGRRRRTSRRSCAEWASARSAPSS